MRYELVIVRSSIDELPVGTRLEIPLDRSIVLGRGRDADIVVASARISRRHARFAIVDGALELEYLGNYQGVLFEGVRTCGARVLVGGRFELPEGCALELCCT